MRPTAAAPPHAPTNRRRAAPTPPAAARSTWRGPPRRSPARHTRSDEGRSAAAARPADDERRSFLRSGADGDRSAVRLRDLAGDVESEPEAGVAAAPVGGTALESLEDPRQGLRR